MAKENGEPKAAEKGKGKMKEDIKQNGEKAEEIKKDKDGKPIVIGKKGEESKDGTFTQFDLWTGQRLTEVCLCRGAQ